MTWSGWLASWEKGLKRGGIVDGIMNRDSGGFGDLGVFFSRSSLLGVLRIWVILGQHKAKHSTAQGRTGTVRAGAGSRLRLNMIYFTAAVVFRKSKSRRSFCSLNLPLSLF